MPPLPGRLFLLWAIALPGWSAEPAWTPLFDGKTLRGWTQRGGKAHYEVLDGAIVGTSVPNTPNSFLCTERSYGDFVLELDSIKTWLNGVPAAELVDSMDLERSFAYARKVLGVGRAD